MYIINPHLQQHSSALFKQDNLDTLTLTTGITIHEVNHIQPKLYEDNRNPPSKLQATTCSPTTRFVPWRSPIQVLTWLNAA